MKSKKMVQISCFLCGVGVASYLPAMELNDEKLFNEVEEMQKWIKEHMKKQHNNKTGEGDHGEAQFDYFLQVSSPREDIINRQEW